MAIRLSEQYPGKTAGNTTDYPYGEARDVTTPGDGTGTPWQKAIVNDDQGFKQALLLAAGINPNGVPDTALASQYLEALRKVSVQAVTAAYAAQTWKNRTSTRVKNTEYTNTGPLDRHVQITVGGGRSTSGNTLVVGGVVTSLFKVHSSMTAIFSFVVRPGEKYQINVTSAIEHWAERD